jgi:predicted GNAT family acetyltransferase
MEQDRFNQVPQVQWTVQDVVFREAQEPDLDFVRNSIMGLSTHTKDKTCDWDEVKKTVHRLMKNPELGTYFVSNPKGHEHFPLAANMMSIEYNILDNRDCCWLQSVYVQAKFRGQGIFKNIYNQTLDLARARGYKKVKLGVETDNEPAKAIYKKLRMSALENAVINELDSVFAFGNIVASHTARVENVAKYVAMIDEISSLETLTTTLEQKLGFNGLELVEIKYLTVDQLEKLNFDGLVCVNEFESDPEANLKNYRGGCLSISKRICTWAGFVSCGTLRSPLRYWHCLRASISTVFGGQATWSMSMISGCRRSCCKTGRLWT